MKLKLSLYKYIFLFCVLITSHANASSWSVTPTNGAAPLRVTMAATNSPTSWYAITINGLPFDGSWGVYSLTFTNPGAYTFAAKDNGVALPSVLVTVTSTNSCNPPCVIVTNNIPVPFWTNMYIELPPTNFIVILPPVIITNPCPSLSWTVIWPSPVSFTTNGVDSYIQPAGTNTFTVKPVIQ